MSSENLFVKCKSCGKNIPKSAKTCPHCGRKKTLSVFHWIIIILGVVMVIGIFNLPDASDSHNSSATNKALNPPDQGKFIEIVAASTKKFKSTKNELQQSALKEERRIHLSNAQIGPSISDWVGTISSLETNSEGKAILSIRISPNIEVKTWNNAVSDINAYTLIEKGSDIYHNLLNLSVGQQVKFSGSFFPSEADFFKETSFGINGSMSYPEFLFKFTSVEVAN